VHFTGAAGRGVKGREEVSSPERGPTEEPEGAEALIDLGLALWRQGRHKEAVAAFERAIERRPFASRPYIHLANALCERGPRHQALAFLREGLRLMPHAAELHGRLAQALLEAGAVPAALHHHREAVRLGPGSAGAHVELGMVLLQTGDLDEALASFREAQRLDPRHPEALAALAFRLGAQLSPAEQAAAGAVLGDETLPPSRRAVLQYGLAYFHDARGDHARAADLAGEANAHLLAEGRRRGRAYDPAAHHAHVSRVIAAYDAAHFERVRGWGLGSERPVFVVGLPRSGTSLTEQVLASHPRVFGGGELPFLRDSSPDGLGCLGDRTPAAARQLAGQYLERLAQLHPSAERVVDKMPDNYLLLGLVATLLPGARIIHVRRDPRDVAVSCWLTYFREVPWSLDPGHIAGRIREHARLMAHWRRVLPVPLLEIDYEELVADTEAAARRLVGWCGLDWDPACLDFHRTRRVVRTASMMQVRTPVYRRSVGRWKNYADHLGPLFALLPGPAPPDEEAR
jgi:Flp pilus assembly protein TadD